MALFQILRGDSSRIDTSSTPFNDGYAYFTPDDGGFYIDSENNGVQKRIRINPSNKSNSKAITSTLKASGWISGKQTISINDLKAYSNGLIGVAPNITTTQMNAVKKAELYISDQNDSGLTVCALGDIPNTDIPVIIILFD